LSTIAVCRCLVVLFTRVLIRCCRYYAIALVNKEGTVLKMGGTAKVQGLTVVYQIHREGIAAPLSYAPLSEAWSDHMYYFATVSFKRSGRYTLSFITEGENAAAIKPLIYPVVVEARTVRCGIPHALDRLYAAQYLDAIGRAVLVGRREVIASIEQTYNEVDAVRAALLMVYLSLPSGALVQDLAVDNATAAKGNSFALITEPAGWNDVLDQAWRGAVYQATTPLQLMECALLLEHYVSKQWLAYPQSRLLSALPGPHFALTCATYSSVALRVYCLDKALMYDKVVAAPRERRSAGGFESYAYEEPPKAAARASATLIEGRSRRPAAAQASARIKSTVNYNEDSGEEDDEGGDSEVAGAAPQQPQKWNCAECTVSNEARARSCSACGARKPAPGAAPAAAADRSRDRGSRDTGRNARAASSRRDSGRKGRNDSDEEEEEEDSEGSDSSGSDSEGGSEDGSDKGSEANSQSGSDEEQQDSASESERRGGRGARASSRRRSDSRHSEEAAPQRKSGRANVSNTAKYFEDSEDNEDADSEEAEFEGGSSSKRRRESSKGGADSRTHKRAKEMSDAEYLAEYKRNVPQRVAEFSAQIKALAATAETDPKADLQMRCLSILRQLVADTRTEPFWVPVDTKAVPSYLHFIKQPMDLGTIRKRVVSGHYGTDADKFAAVSVACDVLGVC
jgi:hypothetical protein